jgi:hypothetical protein
MRILQHSCLDWNTGFPPSMLNNRYQLCKVRGKEPGNVDPGGCHPARVGRVGSLLPKATDDIIERINDFLFDKGEKSAGEPAFPYIVNKDFLSPAEHNFFSVLRTTVSNQATISTKVSLGDLFDVSSKDPSEFRIYRKKINRKHVDFLLCDPKTLRPLVGIE